ncbi:MAG: hypothetical protein LWX83_18820, partial [Anaerolineae bacterium]|nr:hypothetical protein [Anaerolineae bacterium]
DQAVNAYPEYFQALTGQEVPKSLGIVKIVSNFPDLRYRTMPNITSAIRGYLQQGKVYSSSQQNGVWYYIDELNGWANGGFLTVIG